MRQKRPSVLGEQESILLRYVVERGRATVGETLEGFGEPKGLTRSTVVTVMNRLCEKGYLVREKDGEDVYSYRPVQPRDEVLGGIVDRFIERTLGGQMTALTAYFTRSERLSDSEKTELKRILEKMEDHNERRD